MALLTTAALVSAVEPPTTAPAANVTLPAVPVVIDSACPPSTVEVTLKLTTLPARLPVSVIAPPPGASSTGPVKATPEPAVFTSSVPFSVVLVAAV